MPFSKGKELEQNRTESCPPIRLQHNGAGQFRNNARAVRAATYHQVSNTFISHWDSLARDAETLSVMLRGCRDFASLTDHVEQSRYYLGMMANMRRFENAWFQYKVGVLKETDWIALAYDLDSLFAYPGTRFAWEGIKNRSSVEFRKYVDEVSKRQAAPANCKPPAQLPSLSKLHRSKRTKA